MDFSGFFKSQKRTYQFIGSVSRSGFDFYGTWSEFFTATSTVEMVRMVHFSSEPQRFTINNGPEIWKRNIMKVTLEWHRWDIWMTQVWHINDKVVTLEWHYFMWNWHDTDINPINDINNGPEIWKRNTMRVTLEWHRCDTWMTQVWHLNNTGVTLEWHLNDNTLCETGMILTSTQHLAWQSHLHDAYCITLARLCSNIIVTLVWHWCDIGVVLLWH